MARGAGCPIPGCNVPSLQPGQRFRMPEEGPQGALWRVVRLSPCAAYVREVYARPRAVELVARDGSVRRFQVTEGSGTVSISLHAAVELVEGGA
jgi:hypothetical protein